MGKNGFFTLALVLALLAAPGAAFAQKAKAGIAYGLSVPDAPNTNPYMMFGVMGAAYLVPSFSTGGYFLASDKQGQPSATDKFQYSLAGVEAVYHMPSENGEMHFGLRVGITKVNTSPQGEDATFSPYHYGIRTGYDYKLFTWLRVGFEGSYLHVERGKTTQGGTTTIQLDSFNIMSFLATFQIGL